MGDISDMRDLRNLSNLRGSHQDRKLLISPVSMEAFNIKFVGVVEKYPVLYDFTLPEYSRKDITEKAWHLVATEFSLSVNDCKERWKNLRTAFLRRLKAPPSGSSSKAKKTYYLHDALQFILPFTKSNHPTSGNLPETPQRPEENDFEVLDSTPGYADSIDDYQFSPPPPSLLSPTTSVPPVITPSAAQNSMPIASQEFNNTPPNSNQLPQSEPTIISRKQLSGKKRRIHTTESDVDKAIAEYFVAKKSTLYSKDGRKEAIAQFLNSLVPDLLQLSDAQLRYFKRKTLLLIDEVIGTTPLETVYGSKYSFDCNAHSSQTPSPTFLSSGEPSASITSQSPDNHPGTDTDTMQYTNL